MIDSLLPVELVVKYRRALSSKSAKVDLLLAVFMIDHSIYCAVILTCYILTQRKLRLPVKTT